MKGNIRCDFCLLANQYNIGALDGLICTFEDALRTGLVFDIFPIPEKNGNTQLRTSAQLFSFYGKKTLLLQTLC